MSTAVLPSLPGLTYDIIRTQVWDTITQSAVSGKETRLALQTYPRWRWELVFNMLRSAAAYTEFQQLVGFINARQGMFDSFLYIDSDDNTVISQAIGTGDGTTRTFQLVRAFGTFVEPVLAPNVVSHVYRAGVDHSDWTISNWGTTTPGLVTFSVAPTLGQAITADFTYYWPCRFEQDATAFNLFMNQYYACKKLSFMSVKN